MVQHPSDRTLGTSINRSARHHHARRVFGGKIDTDPYVMRSGDPYVMRSGDPYVMRSGDPYLMPSRNPSQVAGSRGTLRAACNG